MVLAVELALRRVACAISSCAVQQALSTAIDKVPTEALIAQLLLLLALRLLLWLLLLLQVNVSAGTWGDSYAPTTATHRASTGRYECRIIWRIVADLRWAIADFLWETAKEKEKKGIGFD